MERAYLDAERRRVLYVAATRARDMLVIPKAGDVPPGRFVCGDLLADAPDKLTRTMEAYVDGAEPVWARQVGPQVHPARGDAADFEQQVTERWASVSREAAQPRFRPASVSGEGSAVPAVESDEPLKASLAEPREGRFGGLFGRVVHHAIGMVLRNSALTPEDAVRQAAECYELAEHLNEAADDVERAMDALLLAGLARPPGTDLQIEYPIAGSWDGGQLVSGYIDLVAVTDSRADIIDFKTDAPPRGTVEEAYPGYVAQVSAYSRLLTSGGVLGDRRIRCGLLFTADGGIRWIEGS